MRMLFLGGRLLDCAEQTGWRSRDGDLGGGRKDGEDGSKLGKHDAGVCRSGVGSGRRVGIKRLGRRCDRDVASAAVVRLSRFSGGKEASLE